MFYASYSQLWIRYRNIWTYLCPILLQPLLRLVRAKTVHHNTPCLTKEFSTEKHIKVLGILYIFGHLLPLHLPYLLVGFLWFPLPISLKLMYIVELFIVCIKALDLITADMFIRHLFTLTLSFDVFPSFLRVYLFTTFVTKIILYKKKTNLIFLY